MIPAAPRWFTHSSTALSAGHPCPPHRGFTQLAILRLLDATPVGQASRQTIRFQQDCDCVSNTQRMQEDLQAALMAQGVLQRPESIERLPWAKLQQWMFGAANRRVELAKESRRLIELNARHGPLALVLHGAIPQGQGEGVYQNHHAVVLLATWCCGDRPLGLLLDGNDRQQNPAIEAIRAWQRASGDQRPLQELGPQDLEQINDALAAQQVDASDASLDLFQFAYRVVDLDTMLQRAQAHYQAALQSAQGALLEPVEPYPNSVSYDPGCLLRTALLSPTLVESLNAAIEQDACLVEPEC